uniref:ZP domain-containing protein n=1 Tax=Mola mola TaxID=94237 RepID=A0A3Q3WY17_MOLML
ECQKETVEITWKIHPDFVKHAARLFLGNCMPTRFNLLETGEGEAHFNYRLDDCRFRKQVKGKWLFYHNELTYRPQAKTKPAAYVYPIKCAHKPDVWVPSFLNPGSGVSEGRGGLVFQMALLNQLTGMAKTNIISLGSFMPIWAAVEQKSHQPLLLLMDECVAAPTPELQPGSQVYSIIGNKCLLESMRGNSRFLPRYHSSAVILYLQSFKPPFGQEVYIHCNLVAWDPNGLNEGKKACNYVKETGWQLLDNTAYSSLCDCCESTCKSRKMRSPGSKHGMVQNAVLGPLT